MRALRILLLLLQSVVRSDEEWQRMLSPGQYKILRQAGTELPRTRWAAPRSALYHRVLHVVPHPTVGLYDQMLHAQLGPQVCAAEQLLHSCTCAHHHQFTQQLHMCCESTCWGGVWMKVSGKCQMTALHICPQPFI
jgi:hypothetical protein